MTDAAPAPVAERDRIHALDVVRGLAVLGILAMNVVEFALPMEAYQNPGYAGGSTGADRWTWYLQTALFDGKMRALFSMLFGAGLVLLDERMRATGRGDRAADILLRRCLWLVPFGMLHRFALQWTGDILWVYGLLGVLVIAFRRLPVRTLVLLGLLVHAGAVPIALYKHHKTATLRDDAARAERLEADGAEVPAELARARTTWQRRLASFPPDPAVVEREVQTMRGGYATVFAHRWDYHHTFQSAYLYYWFFWDVTGAMLLGMALLRSGFLAGRLRTGTYLLFVALGAASSIAAFVWARAVADGGFSRTALGLQLLHDVLHPFERILGALAWAALLLLLLRAGMALRALGNVGRMAFSNYVLQTVCCTLFFFGYGLGNYGALSRAETMWVLLGVTALQLVFSGLWLRRFRFGPLEWAWRSLTYWRRQPLLR